jgi:selenocysteine-specific elongation factor
MPTPSIDPSAATSTATRTLVVGTAGHIDHGKSALVRALTGTDPDRLKEERERGITIDLGFAHTQIDDVNIAFVDVPGHERFVKNMLAGVGGIDAVLLVVAADESIMPQTREHFEICRLLDIPSGLVVLTKSDLVDEDTIELVRLEVRDLVAGTFLERAPVIPVSAKTGAGLDALRAALVQVSRQQPSRSAAGAVRLPIDRVFSMKGFGTVVTGTLVSGVIRPDDELLVLPQGRSVKVRGVQVHGAKTDSVRAGNRVALNLGGVDVSEVARGDSLVTGGTFIATRIVDVVIDVIEGARPIRHGARVRFHQGTTELLGRVALGAAERLRQTSLSAAGDADASRPAARAAEVAAGERAYARIRLEHPAVLTRDDRFILRAYSPPVTIAGGSVLDPHPPRTGIRSATASERFAALNTAGVSRTFDAVAWMIAQAGRGGLARTAIVSRAGVAPRDADAIANELIARGRALAIGDALIAVPVVASIESALRTALAEHHRIHPLAPGMPREEAREKLFARAHPDLFEFSINRLVAAKAITSREHLALSSHQLALSPEEERTRVALGRAFESGGLKPPELAEIATQQRVSASVVDRIVNLLVRQKILVRVDTLIFHQEALRRLRTEIAAMKTAAGGRAAEIDVATFKERYGVTRKYAIPLLEYLDRERVTRRVGDKRVIV